MHILKVLRIVAPLLTSVCPLNGSQGQPGQIASVGQRGLQITAQDDLIRRKAPAKILLNKLGPSHLHSTILADTSCSKNCGTAEVHSSCSTSCPSGGVCTAYCRGTTAYC